MATTIRVAALAAAAALASMAPGTSARAEWFARCEGGQNATCHGEACGATPDEARALCLEQCPGSDTHSVGTASCQVQRRTQTPPVRATPPTSSSKTLPSQ